MFKYFSLTHAHFVEYVITSRSNYCLLSIIRSRVSSSLANNYNAQVFFESPTGVTVVIPGTVSTVTIISTTNTLVPGSIYRSNILSTPRLVYGSGPTPLSSPLQLITPYQTLANRQDWEWYVIWGSVPLGSYVGGHRGATVHDMYWLKYTQPYLDGITMKYPGSLNSTSLLPLRPDQFLSLWECLLWVGSFLRSWRNEVLMFDTV